MNAKQIWQTTMERLQARVNPAIFTTWFQGTSALSFQDGVFTVRVPTSVAKAQLEGRFIDAISSILDELIGSSVEVRFIVAKEVPEQVEELRTEARPFGSKRSYRLGRGRHAALARDKRPTSNPATIKPAPTYSMASLFPSPGGTHLGEQAEEQNRQEMADQAHNQPIQHEQPAAPDHANTSVLSGSSAFAGEGLLNPRYTFNAFIVGKSNQLAHAASLAVSENPGRIYNPLFLYGGVGLGKTHLLHAVGHMGETAGLTVLYVTSEKFTNEIINAIRFQKTEEFRAKYRQIDILLVDDIQFIAGKESTEEEFFHTFNTLHNANKQIVVTSDRPPKAIHSLQDRLRSRFEWGLLADVQAPEYEHRLAILRSKAESLHFAIPGPVIEYIARPQCSSVRELEGALNRVIAYATLHDAPLSVSLAAQALEHIYSDKKVSTSLTVAEVIEGVCRYYNIDSTRIRGKQRDRETVWPRQVAMYLMREETTASLLQIGTELGRDHTTIMHGWEKVHAEMTHNERVRQEVAAVLESIQRR
ncbi:chromosomal replication initiator protein DnaA [Ktedonosporobacter rubrisoli]|uniref:Chromosomal replication initiator protein DnaA n=1 Tax=Ktedonosporobacter rubrisoli TaxID=2509675 RepID=A0A4P6JU09_KTERU|nr:chromosomal replication initiator protein DnaA [Ktedonosporobacter rubrisoli]QBD79099.1 chromosomal replication initiator protein DnaA [Ktedonosporobacter rubrisoli]